MRIGLDVDGILASFTQAIIDRARIMGLARDFPKDWRHVATWKIASRFPEVWAAVKDDELFWTTIEPHEMKIPFQPAVYITQRPCSVDITRQWIKRHGFPAAPVFRTPEGGSKAGDVKLWGLDAFVDDRALHFLSINEDTDAICYLFDRPWNQNVEAGALRIHSLEDIPLCAPSLSSAFSRAS